MHIIPHNLLSDERMWAHSCCLTPPPPHEKNGWFKWKPHIEEFDSIQVASPSWLSGAKDRFWIMLYLSFIFVSLPLCNKYSDDCDIYLYTLCDYICCLLWRMYEMHLALSLKTGCYRSGIRGMLTVGRNLDRNGPNHYLLTILWFFLYFSWSCLTFYCSTLINLTFATLILC
jgi:hypothetical protein